MSYIGREPQVGNFQVCDAISVVNGQAAYTMQVSSVNVSPETANHMLVSLNGVIQKPGSSYTVSGSTITFASNLATGDVINFIHILGSVLDLGVPSDDTVATAKIVDDAVTAAKLNDNVISGQTALTDAPADTDELLVSDAGTIKRVDVSLVKGVAGIVSSANATAISINSDEKVSIGDTDHTSAARFRVAGTLGSPLVVWYDARSTSTVDVFQLYSDVGGTENKNFQIEADGDVQNTNNSYGSLSDRKFKENETNASSQWEDIKALQIKNYNLKIHPDIKHIGVVAQDLEDAGMNGLVKIKPDVLYTENESLPEGKNVGDVKEETYKEVKYSILYMKSVKALQEAMERIETLENKVKVLEE